MDWSDLYLFATFRFYVAIFLFLTIVLIGFGSIVGKFVVNYVIREMGGLKGLLASLGWCLGAALAATGAFQLLISFGISLFTLADTGKFLGVNASTHLASYVVGSSFALVGGGLFWLLREWPNFAGGKAALVEEAVSRKRAEVARWGTQWCFGTAAAYFIVMLLPLMTTTPTWLAKRPGEITLTEVLIASIAGVIWAFVDHFWRKSKRDATSDAA